MSPTPSDRLPIFASPYAEQQAPRANGYFRNPRSRRSQVQRPQVQQPLRASTPPNWPLSDTYQGPPTSPQARSEPPGAGSAASYDIDLSTDDPRDMREQGNLEADRAYLKEARENVADYRKPFDFTGRIVGLFAGFTGVGIAIISTVAALVPHALGIALFAAPQFAIPMAIGITLVGLLAAWGIRSMGRVYAQRQESVRTDGDFVENLKQRILSKEGPLTGPRQRLLRAADRYLASVDSVRRDTGKTLRDGLMGVLWPASMFTGLLLALRPTPRR